MAPNIALMSEIWENTLDKGGYVCAIFMDFSNAFDALNLLTTRLGAHGFERDLFFYKKLL